MAGERDQSELIQLIHRRANLLATLSTGASEKPELVDELAVSRSTVDRALRELRVHSLVDRTDDGYVATVPGRMAAAEHEAAMSGLTAAHEARDVLDHLPTDAPMDPVFLRDADVQVPRPPAPHHPLEDLGTRVVAADRYRGFASALLEARYVDEMRNRVLAGDIDLEIIYSTELATYLAEVHTESLQEVLDDDTATMYVSDEIPYELGILGGDSPGAFVMAIDEDAAFKGLIVNDSPAAIEWAEDLYERIRSDASEFDFPG